VKAHLPTVNVFVHGARAQAAASGIAEDNSLSASTTAGRYGKGRTLGAERVGKPEMSVPSGKATIEQRALSLRWGNGLSTAAPPARR